MKARIYPPIYLALSILAMTALDHAMPLAEYSSKPLQLAGQAIIALGIGLIFTSAYQFHKANTTIKPFAESSSLITHGLFSRSRNPIYLGMMLIVFGSALWYQSLSPYVMPFIFFLIIQFGFILREEKHLSQQFGDEYLSYKNTVRRWI